MEKEQLNVKKMRGKEYTTRDTKHLECTLMYTSIFKYIHTIALSWAAL